VVIVVSPAAPTPELARILENACTDAVRPSRCEVRAGDTETPDVLVTWTTESSALVEARRTNPPLTRSLIFRAEDPERDRWRSLGLVAAALASRAATDQTPPAETAPAHSPEPAFAGAQKRRPPILWFDGGAILGNGIEYGPVAFGGALRGGYQLPVVPIFVGAGASYASAGLGPQGLESSWTTFFASAGTVVALSDFALRPRLELLLTRLVAKSPDAPGGGSSDSRRLGGAGAGLEAAWPSTERVALVLGAEGSFLSSGTSVRVGEDRVSAFPALSYRFFLGIQVSVLP
jgi:hypothetical protein